MCTEYFNHALLILQFLCIHFSALPFINLLIFVSFSYLALYLSSLPFINEDCPSLVLHHFSLPCSFHNNVLSPSIWMNLCMYQYFLGVISGNDSVASSNCQGLSCRSVKFPLTTLQFCFKKKKKKKAVITHFGCIHYLTTAPVHITFIHI